MKGYYKSYKKWGDCLKKNGVVIDQGSLRKPLILSIYLASLIQEGVSVSVLTSAVYGIRWAYSVIELHVPPPTDSELVKNVFESGKKKTVYTKNEKSANYWRFINENI